MSDSTPNIEQLVSAALLRLRIRSPFFATLALFATIKADRAIPAAATDGREVRINPDYFQALSPAQRDGALLHVILHAALLHVPRRGERDRETWNLAADIVVNGIVVGQAGCEVPLDSPRDLELERFSVEEVYELLRFSPDRQPQRSGMDLFDSFATTPGEQLRGGDEQSGSLAAAQRAALESHWRSTMQQASAIAEALQPGQGSAAMRRELDALTPGKLDWKAQLWRYLSQTPSDFQGFDRRFVGRRLYLEALEGEALRLFIAVDTSGSVQNAQVQAFVSEVQTILRAYPHLSCELYYADTDLYGPYTLTADSPIPPPEGGGGTDFQPFFAAVETLRDHRAGLCVYLTDGMGLFPAQPPALPVLWVVTPGGADLDHFPFGEAVRLCEG